MRKVLEYILIIAALLVVVGSVGAWWMLYGQRAPQDEVSNDPAVIPAPSIRFTGEVKAKQYASLGFEATGVAETVAVKVGDTVERGQELIVLDRELQEAAVAGAYAERVSARDNALVALESAQSARFKTKSENKQTVAKARQKVIDTKQELDDAKKVFSRTALESGDDAAVTATKELAITTAEKAYNAAQEELTEARATQSKEDSAATQAEEAARAAYASTTRSSLTTSGAAALAALETSARVQLARKILLAPFSGTVTKLDLQPNELVVGGQPVLTIQTIDTLEIEGLVSETDITKLSENMDASVTFDAFGDETFTATLSRIEPAGEKVNGVTRYTVYLDIHDTDRRLRPGFTANITVAE